MVTAAAVASLVDVAPGRVNVGIGSGFTGRMAMGQRPNSWESVARYARQLRALLAGETVEVDGAMTRMLHGADQAPRRPIRVPVVFGTRGPRGEAVARKEGDGVFSTTPTPGFAWSILLTLGTVMEPGETAASPRVREAAGAGAAVVLHRAYEYRNVPGLDLDGLPGGAEWRAGIEAIPEGERHLRTHAGHLTTLNEVDRRVVSGDLIRRVTFTASAYELRSRLAELATRGVTEIAYQPSGPDVPRELTAFARMAGLG
jgi:5,10-methylenetetrahydromethanopterin reductase